MESFLRRCRERGRPVAASKQPATTGRAGCTPEVCLLGLTAPPPYTRHGTVLLAPAPRPLFCDDGDTWTGRPLGSSRGWIDPLRAYRRGIGSRAAPPYIRPLCTDLPLPMRLIHPRTATGDPDGKAATSALPPRPYPLQHPGEAEHAAWHKQALDRLALARISTHSSSKQASKQAHAPDRACASPGCPTTPVAAAASRTASRATRLID